MKMGTHILNFFVLIFLFFTFCKKKEESPPPPANTTTTSTTYSPQSTGTSSNPCSPCVTVTGTNTPGNTATQNSALTVGGPGWIYNSCASTPNALTGINGSTEVQITFGDATINAGVYALTSGIPTSGQARMTVTDAPGQPSGIIWYSKNGSVSVSTGTSGTIASFNNIACLQLNYLFPTVTASGSLTCN